VREVGLACELGSPCARRWQGQGRAAEAAYLGWSPQLYQRSKTEWGSTVRTVQINSSSKLGAQLARVPLVPVLNVDSRVRGGESNGSCYEPNRLELTVIYCEQV
jgi:hypothetical protein